MDSVTHAILGAAIAQTGFRQKIGRDATLLAALAAYAPDLDVFAAGILRRLGNHDPFLGQTIHRGLTHSLLMIPLICLPLAWAWWRVRRRVIRRRQHIPAGRPVPSASLGWVYACALAAMISHPLLDWLTSYGTQLFAPLTNHRYAADSVAIIDVFYTAAVSLTVLACWLTRLIARRPMTRATLAIGWAGLLLSTAYLATGRVMHDRAIDKVLADQRPAQVVSADAYPGIGSIFLWRVVIRTPQEWIVAKVHQFGGRPVVQRAAIQPPDEWTAKALARPEARHYDWFTGGHYRVESDATEGGHVVALEDMRYSWDLDSPKSLWPMQIVFDQAGNFVRVESGRPQGPGVRRGVAWVLSAWKDIWNP